MYFIQFIRPKTLEPPVLIFLNVFYILPCPNTRTIADANKIAFSALLKPIGFDANTMAYIVAQGFTMAKTFTTLPFSSYNDRLKNIMKIPTGYAARQQPNYTLWEGFQDVDRLPNPTRRAFGLRCLSYWHNCKIGEAR
jgi:hypothetical protein